MTTSTGLRILGRLRLSKLTDESTSIVRQREMIQQWCELQGHTVVGWAEDTDVSGTVDPFDTAELGEWLQDRHPEFDAIAVWKLDRLSRSTINLNKLFAWCLEHGKTVVSVTESIDLGTPVGRLIANVIGFLAEGELEAITERIRSSRVKLREDARWGGGLPPYGYVPEPRPDGGKGLKVDESSRLVVRRIVDDVLAGKPVARIANELNAEGYLTPRQYYETGFATVKLPYDELPQDKYGHRKPGWHSTNLRRLLRSKALLGHVIHQGQTVRGDDGMPLKMADEIIDPDEYELVQAHLDRVATSRRGLNRADFGPLYQIAVCFDCGELLQHNKTTAGGKVYRYYRCKNKNKAGHIDCGMLNAGEFEELVAEAFLSEVGDVEDVQRIWVRGDSRAEELNRAVTALDELSAAALRMTSATAKQRLQRQLDSLDALIAELEAAPAREGSWELRSTGITYRDAWGEGDGMTAARRDLVVRSGITVAAIVTAGTKSFSWEIRVPADVKERMRKKSRA